LKFGSAQKDEFSLLDQLLKSQLSNDFLWEQTVSAYVCVIKALKEYTSLLPAFLFHLHFLFQVPLFRQDSVGFALDFFFFSA